MALILEEARSRLPAPFDQRQLEIIATEERHKFDALYAELEDTFRGSPEEIKERFKAYLPHIKSLVVTDDTPIADLGCGRGEWLELLKEEGYRALGIDNNQVLLDRCRARGLEVIESDALQYLRGRPDNSLSAITGFHIIEHLQIDVLMSLLDEIVRVLHPGGVVIFETPNPENVLVGSNYFYFDPTHRNPLPSLLMKFLLEARGLHRIEVMNLHAWDQARISGKNQLTTRFNELFYGPMDYAIAGWKVPE
jgi:O-antigen chain-terminating methyltransferase